MKNTIITIGREFGAGGRELGRRLSDKLGIPYYDKELLEEAAKNSGLAEDFLKAYDEKHSSNVLRAMTAAPQFVMDAVGTNWSEMAAAAIHSAILEVAKESCVVVGRHADYILRNHDGLFRIFVTASAAKRIEHIMERDTLPRNEAEKKLRQMDKARSASYNYYTNQIWGQASNYDLCLNLGLISTDTAVKIILETIKSKGE